MRISLMFAAVVLGGCLASPEVSARVCEPGVWDIANQGKTPDGQAYAGAATSTRYCLFDGAVEMDEFRALSPDGRIVFLGVSFHHWSEDSQSVRTLWLMGGDPGHTLIRGAMEQGRLVSEGEGADAGGAFLERSVETYTGARDYQFSMDRSFDGGQTWIEGFSVLEARFRTSETPPLPAALHPIVQQARENLPARTGAGAPILEGFAEIEEIDGEHGGTLRFSSRYMAPDRWRSVYWALGADTIRVEELPIESAAQ